MAKLDAVLTEVSRKELINDNVPSIDLIDMDYFKSRVQQVKEAFNEPFFLHALALKANSIRGVLLAAKDLGMGAECASISEVEHAIALGFDPEKVVFDSPCKSKPDLKRGLDLNVLINLDNDFEAERVSLEQ